MAKPIKCLLIEDDLDDQEIFALCLEKIDKPVECTTANNGVEALNLLHSKESFTPDVIFVDVNMPRMNGLDCLRHLKEISRLANTQIYVYSTTSEYSVVKLSKDLGANEYIVKPTKTAELKEKLAQVFTHLPAD